MCGRAYSIYTEEELRARYHVKSRKVKPLREWAVNYNLAPTQYTSVVLMREGEFQIEVFRWGLVPFWAKDVKSAAKYSLINAKAEEIELKRTYKAAFEKRRCIIPVSGFYEWHTPKSGPKRPFAIFLKDHSILSLAGVWEAWKSPETGEEIRSFSIITCKSNSKLTKIHERMPVVLSPKDEEFWLDPDHEDLKGLKKLLKPYPPKEIEFHEVSTLVNSPKNNSPEIFKSNGKIAA
jgi:putative SOS response-associated peptidase YedK